MPEFSTFCAEKFLQCLFSQITKIELIIIRNKSIQITAEIMERIARY